MYQANNSYFYQSNINHLAEPEFGRTKKIHVWEYGDSYNKDYEMFINPNSLRTWNSVLRRITDVINPSFGAVRKLVALVNRKIVLDFTELEHNGKYVAIGALAKIKVQPHTYKTVSELDLIAKSKKMKKLYSGEIGPPEFKSLLESTKRRLTITFVLVNGRPCQAPTKLVLTKEDLRSWNLMLEYLAKVMDVPDGIQHVCTIFGEVLLSTDQLQHGFVYVAVPFNEKFVKMDYMNVFSKKKGYTLKIKPARARGKTFTSDAKNRQQKGLDVESIFTNDIIAQASEVIEASVCFDKAVTPIKRQSKENNMTSEVLKSYASQLSQIEENIEPDSKEELASTMNQNTEQLGQNSKTSFNDTNEEQTPKVGSKEEISESNEQAPFLNKSSVRESRTSVDPEDSVENFEESGSSDEFQQEILEPFTKEMAPTQAPISSSSSQSPTRTEYARRVKSFDETKHRSDSLEIKYDIQKQFSESSTNESETSVISYDFRISQSHGRSTVEKLPRRSVSLHENGEKTIGSSSRRSRSSATPGITLSDIIDHLNIGNTSVEEDALSLGHRHSSMDKSSVIIEESRKSGSENQVKSIDSVSRKNRTSSTPKYISSDIIDHLNIDKTSVEELKETGNDICNGIRSTESREHVTLVSSQCMCPGPIPVELSNSSVHNVSEATLLSKSSKPNSKDALNDEEFEADITEITSEFNAVLLDVEEKAIQTDALPMEDAFLDYLANGVTIDDMTSENKGARNDSKKSFTKFNGITKDGGITSALSENNLCSKNKPVPSIHIRNRTDINFCGFSKSKKSIICQDNKNNTYQKLYLNKSFSSPNRSSSSEGESRVQRGNKCCFCIHRKKTEQKKMNKISEDDERSSRATKSDYLDTEIIVKLESERTGEITEDTNRDTNVSSKASKLSVDSIEGRLIESGDIDQSSTCNSGGGAEPQIEEVANEFERPIGGRCSTISIDSIDGGWPECDCEDFGEF